MEKVNPIWKAIVIYILVLVFISISYNCVGQVVVTHYNAEWNDANKVEWFGKLSDCDLTQVNITKEPKLQQKHKIVVVPTIIIYKDGEEIKRFQADMSFKMLATRKEVQEAIDEQILSDF
jgi:hypothetical protein|tara:strand:- start:61 stop:420 length:360 start_codon:yes stop_codon:yes gene_type:complete